MRGVWEGKGGILPPRSFLKVGAYGAILFLFVLVWASSPFSNVQLSSVYSLLLSPSLSNVQYCVLY